MALPNGRQDREYKKFVDDGSGNVAVRTSITPGTAASSLGKAEDAAHTSGDVGVMSLGVRKDTAAQTAGTDGDYCPPIFNSTGHQHVAEGFAPQAEDNTNGVIAGANKKLAVSTYSPSLFQNLGANATLNVKASTGNVFAVKCHNLNASARYIQLHNTATTPSGGAVPAWTALVPGNTEVVFGEDFFSQSGINFATGIAFAFSTTEATYTAGTAGDQMTHITYK